MDSSKCVKSRINVDSRWLVILKQLCYFQWWPISMFTMLCPSHKSRSQSNVGVAKVWLHNIRIRQIESLRKNEAPSTKLHMGAFCIFVLFLFCCPSISMPTLEWLTVHFRHNLFHYITFFTFVSVQCRTQFFTNVVFVGNLAKFA